MNLDGDYLQPREAGLAETIGRLQVELNQERAEVRRLRAAVEAVEKLADMLDIVAEDAEQGMKYHAETDNAVGLVGEQALKYACDAASRMIRSKLAEHLGTGSES